MNKILLKGRLTADPEMKTINDGANFVTKFSIAVNRKYVKEGEERTADFFNCSCFGKTAEFVQKYFFKGQEMLLEGRLQNHSWEDDQGVKRYATDVIAEQIEFCGSKKENNNSIDSTDSNNFTTTDYDDDLPF